MNRTPSLTMFSNTTPKQESIESQKYFLGLYPEIKYVKESDSFEYRGLILDYFKAGVKIPFLSKEKDDGFTGGYLLVDLENYRNNWLFTYGEKEQMWAEFIERKNKNKQHYIQKKNKNWLQRLFKI